MYFQTKAYGATVTAAPMDQSAKSHPAGSDAHLGRHNRNAEIDADQPAQIPTLPARDSNRQQHEDRLQQREPER